MARGPHPSPGQVLTPATVPPGPLHGPDSGGCEFQAVFPALLVPPITHSFSGAFKPLIVREASLSRFHCFPYPFFIQWWPLDVVFPGGTDGKESACSAGDLGSIPVLGRSPGEGKGNPLLYSCPENPMDRGAWRATVHGVHCGGGRDRPAGAVPSSLLRPHRKPSARTRAPWTLASASHHHQTSPS